MIHTSVLNENSYHEAYINDFIKDRMERGISTFKQELNVRGNFKKATEFIRKHYAQYTMFSVGCHHVVIRLPDAIMEVSSYSNMIEFSVYGTFERIDALRTEVISELEEIKTYINWVYGKNGDDTRVPLDSSTLPVTEFFPFLDGESLHDYYTRFAQSSASILLLIGPPGTGKTSFIRGYLADTNSSALVTYDEGILGNDAIFARFIGGSDDTLVIEDADLFLSTRQDGNTMMHKFLNVGDGLVTAKGKKMIFSTNLPNTLSIDTALLRKGRCFDVLHFSALTGTQARHIGTTFNLSTPFNSEETYTLADIFGSNQPSKNVPVHKFGF